MLTRPNGSQRRRMHTAHVAQGRNTPSSGCNHAADDGGGNGLHDVGTDAGLPEDRRKAEDDGSHSHQFGTQTLHGALDGCLFNIGLIERSTAVETIQVTQN